MTFVDTHTHIYSEQFEEDRDAMLNRAFELGVNQLFMPNVDSASIKGMMDLAQRYPQQCYPMMGLHPCSVKEHWETELATVRQWLFGGTRFYAVGEIGLDYYWDKTFITQQQQAFRQQIDWAAELALPIVIHSRDSLQDTISIVGEMHGSHLKGIFHCFTGSMQEAEAILRLDNFYLGIGGVVTFKKSGLDEIVRQIPLERLVLETDAPYLAPTPHRGKRNEPAYIRLVAEKIAEVKGTDIGTLAKVTEENSKRVFGIF
ncbi:MAG: TatD family hydrolase [Chitinophagales bacterium]|nr:TatD family hydrolase [Chitinophagales bacterium]